jgi:hypothetical protein
MKVACGAHSLLVALVLASPLAHARSRTSFVHRVDLRTGAVTKLVDLEGGQRNLRVPAARPAGWWKAPAGSRPWAIHVDVDRSDRGACRPAPPLVRSTEAAAAGLRPPQPESDFGTLD